MIIQWGKNNVTNGGNWFTFPITHTTSNGKIIATHWYEGGWAIIGTLTVTAFHIDAFFMSYIDTTENKDASFHWFSIGY